MVEKRSPEWDFLRKGQLFKIVKGNLLTSTQVATSIVLGQERNFSHDSEKLIKNAESVTVLGTEHIPTERKPIIIAANHPDIYDLVLGMLHINQTFAEVRSQHNVPVDINWMVTVDTPKREVMDDPRYKVLYQMIDLGLKRLNRIYNFIPVPLNDQKYNHADFVRSRARALFLARQYLQDKNHSQVVGIFPEAEISIGEDLLPFANGIGVLARSVDNTVILPTGIRRDSLKQLAVEFGKPIMVDPAESPQVITGRVKVAVNMVRRTA